MLMKRSYSGEVEVIAQKKAGVGLMYVVAAIALIFLAFMYCIMDNDLGDFLWIYLATFIVLAIISVVIVVKFLKTKRDMIVREGDTLYFPNGSCKIYELIAVEVRRARARFATYDWGKVIITTESRCYELNFVEDVEVVRTRLLSLMDEYKRPQ